ncbi:MAG: aromatic ring-hydroxylating oxygenase subunit alpha [Pseudomonadales bacterium]
MDAATSNYVKAQIDAEFARFLDSRPPEDFEPFPDIPAGRYIDDEFFDLEQQHVWSKAWLLAGHADELPDAGSYKLWESSGTPILIVRGKDDKVRAFYNTCSHRGGPLVRQETGKEKLFVCKYHCWAYNLDGQLNHIPDEHEFIAIDKSKLGLKPIRCERFGNWIYVNRDPDAMPLTEYLGPLQKELADFQPDKLRFVTRYHYDLRCNWKITMDAFQEVYHLKHIHPQTVDKNLDHRGATMALFPNGSSRMIVPARTGATQFAVAPSTCELDADERYEIVRSGSMSYNMFPNTTTPINALAFPYLQFWPLSKTDTRFEVTWFTREDNADPDSEYWREKIAGFNVILDEDNENLPWIQRSIESGALSGVPLSYQERRIYHFHEYLDQVIGRDKIPAHLQVAPRTAALVEDGKGQRVGQSA